MKIDETTAEELLNQAEKARNNARVPFSGFRVGAALLTDSGEIVTGTNIELSNMIESTCAERCALVKAVSMGFTKFKAIAVISDLDEPVSPCGFCRQSLIDFGTDIEVIMSDCSRKETVVMTTAELLPMAFTGTGK